MEKEENPIYERNTLEFVTVALEYCTFVETAGNTGLFDFVDKATKLLPLLYLKASLLPEVESEEETELELSVSEDMYESVRSRIAGLLGERDSYLETFHADTLRIEVIGHHRILPRRYLHLTPSGRQITFNLSPLSIFRIEDNPHGLRQLIRHPFPIQFNLYSANGIIIQHIAEVTASQHWQQPEEQPENHMPCIFHTTHLPDVRSHTKEIFAFVGPIK